MTYVSPHVHTALRARTVALDAPTDLLERLAPGGFAWLDGDAGFVTAGVVAVLDPDDALAFLRSVPDERDAGVAAEAGPRAVGALPFAGPAPLVVPAVIVGRTRTGAGWCTVIEIAAAGATPLQVAHPSPVKFSVAACTPRRDWDAAVGRALDLIARRHLEKVVLARAVRVEADAAFDVRRVCAELRRTQPGCTVYAHGGYVGASPELLVRKRGADVLARPLAGTGASAQQLLGSPKDAREHQLVVDAVRDALARHCDGVQHDGPAPVELADLTHLGTTVTARAGDDTSVLDLMLALHPTPAVAGTPRGAAVDLIAELETVDRGRYAGPCGWVDARGDGAFVVALRGAEISGSTALLHAGAGIVAGSDPGAEWRETQQKFEPMLRALVRP
jgi:menaquinone-specific isochorismate synthase